jgi:proline dehydrogenase
MNRKISFADTSIAFSYKSDTALRKSYYLFTAINNNLLAKLGTNIVKFAIKVKAPIKGIIRKTVFEQFCGGESIENCEKTINLLSKYNVKTILDYAVEGDSGTKDFERTASEIKKTIDRAESDANIPFSVFKPTGIASKVLLAKIQAGQILTEQEQEDYHLTAERVRDLANHAYNKNVRLFIDSEDSWIQDPIDELVNELMEKYNKEEAIIFNTYQLYRKNMLRNLDAIVQRGREKGFHVGAKLVRGAYMERERERADEMGYEDPIMPSKADTDRQYDDALRFCIENIDVMSICSGSHHEPSNMLLVSLMAEHKLSPDDERIYFAQLYGMSDNISFNLAHAGYNAVKYVPYGPVEAVLPYLFRRAEENTSIAGQSSRELTLVAQELRRRKKND